MRRDTQRLSLISLALVLALPVVAPLHSQKGKPASKPQPTLLVATFRDADGDMIRSDGGGPYVGVSGNTGVAAEIDADGYLYFSPFRGGRRAAALLFPEPIRSGDHALPDDPVTFWVIGTCCPNPLTYQSPLAMEPGDLWVYSFSSTFDTTGSGNINDWFALRFDKQFIDGTRMGGRLQVRALDMNNNGQVDRWIVEPLTDVPATYLWNELNIARYAKPNWSNYGNYLMPFQITFDAPGR